DFLDGLVVLPATGRCVGVPVRVGLLRGTANRYQGAQPENGGYCPDCQAGQVMRSEKEISGAGYGSSHFDKEAEPQQAAVGSLAVQLNDPRDEEGHQEGDRLAQTGG